MVRSMTGFGRAKETLNDREISVELRSVNHRFLELSARIPRTYSFLEEPLRAHIQKSVSRGKIDIAVQIQPIGEKSVVIEPNIDVARGYLNALGVITDKLGVRFDVDALAISRFPDVFTVSGDTPDEEELLSDVLKVADMALSSFLAMRETEGEKMKEDILLRIRSIEETASVIELASPEQIERYRERLTQRMKAVLDTKEIDENRILLEAAIYADKSAVDEETVRLKSHIAQFRNILKANEPVGRKLDFLVQELNREVNTIGSKSSDVDITAKVVDAKAEIEKIREQIQNIE